MKSKVSYSTAVISSPGVSEDARILVQTLDQISCASCSYRAYLADTGSCKPAAAQNMQDR